MSPTVTDPLRPMAAGEDGAGFTWAILFWSALTFVWAIAGANSAQNANDCASESTAELRRLGEDATDIGTGIGVAMILGLWFRAPSSSR